MKRRGMSGLVATPQMTLRWCWLTLSLSLSLNRFPFQYSRPFSMARLGLLMTSREVNVRKMHAQPLSSASEEVTLRRLDRPLRNGLGRCNKSSAHAVEFHVIYDRLNASETITSVS
jgi:hypothetical protein